MLRKVAFFIVLTTIVATIAGAVFGSAASVDVDGGTIQVFTYEVEIDMPPIPAATDIGTGSLQSESMGEMVTVFIELPMGYDPADIYVPSIRLCLGMAPCDSGGVAALEGKLVAGENRLMATFDSSQVMALMSGVTPLAEVNVTISGKVNEESFTGTTSIVFP